MKNKGLKITMVILFIIIIICLIILACFLFVDIKTKTPENIENKYDLTVETFENRNIFIIKSKGSKKTNMKILYFHGGSYMAEATSNHWEFIENLVDDTGATVILPDYPLTPKYNYKDVFNMVVPLYKEIQQRVDVSNELIIMGDSAGGGLSLALLEKISQEDVKMPKKTILISPWLDVRMDNPKIEQVKEQDKKLNKEALKIAGLAYAGSDGIDSYLVNPIDGDLSKINNLTIFTGTKDILNPDVYKLKEKAEKNNINIDINEYQDAGHIWIIDKDSDEEIVKKGYEDLINKIN